MDRQRVLALRQLYRQLPTIDCKRLCGHACRTAIMSDIERRRIEAVTGEAVTGEAVPTWMRSEKNLVCSLLTPHGECSVYGIRPMICRLWGVVDNPGLRCDHGCTVNGDLLTTTQATDILLTSLHVGGGRWEGFVDDMRDAFAIDGMTALVERYIQGDRTVADEIRQLAATRNSPTRSAARDDSERP